MPIRKFASAKTMRLGASPEARNPTVSDQRGDDERADDAEAVDEAADGDGTDAEADHVERVGQRGVGARDTEIGLHRGQRHHVGPQSDAADGADQHRGGEAQPRVGQIPSCRYRCRLFVQRQPWARDNPRFRCPGQARTAANLGSRYAQQMLPDIARLERSAAPATLVLSLSKHGPRTPAVVRQTQHGVSANVRFTPPPMRRPRGGELAVQLGGFATCVPRLGCRTSYASSNAWSSIRRASRISGGARSMSQDRLAAIADRLVAARRQGARVALAGGDAPADFEEGFAIQDKVVAALASPVIGWKVMAVPQGPVIFAPILQSGRVAAGGTWEVVGREPAGIELEIAFRLGPRRGTRRHAGAGARCRGGRAHGVRAVPEPARRAGQAAAPRHAGRLHRQRRAGGRPRDCPAGAART